MADELKVIVIAGPNGAGKTTFAREFLPNEAGCPVFVNADLIASGLAPFAPEAAAVQGGRHIHEDTIRRRFAAGRANFERLYAPLADAWVLYDNAGPEPVLLDWSEKP